MKFILCLVLVCCLIQGNKGARQNRVEDVIFRFFNGDTTSQFVDVYLPNSVSLLTTPGFSPSSPTVIYIHGFNEATDSESMQTIISTYLEIYPNSNIICLDYLNMGSDFFTASINTKLVGAAVAEQMKNLINGGLNRPGIHIISSSLGAHVAGYVGRQLAEDNLKLKRITCFDPVFPGFYPPVFLSHIMGSDADFVDIIHTDAGLLGAPVHTGTADFWPNGGTSVQPGCLPNSPVTPTTLIPLLYCSHGRSWRLWCESLRYPTNFPSVPYTSWPQFISDSRLRNKPINYMGINADVTKSGDFYLQTKSKSLFGKGVAGTVYQLN